MRISDWSSDVCSSDLSWIKAYHAHKAQQIPVNWRISGEGMYAVHSIPYTAANQNALRSYFYGFGVWDENNTLLAWDQTIEVFQMLDINPASVLYHGPYHDGLEIGRAHV